MILDGAIIGRSATGKIFRSRDTSTRPATYFRYLYLQMHTASQQTTCIESLLFPGCRTLGCNRVRPAAKLTAAELFHFLLTSCQVLELLKFRW